MKIGIRIIITFPAVRVNCGPRLHPPQNDFLQHRTIPQTILTELKETTLVLSTLATQHPGLSVSIGVATAIFKGPKTRLVNLHYFANRGPESLKLCEI